VAQTLSRENGSLEVHTFREGVAQKVGHDLIIEVADWKADVELAGDGALSSVSLEADPQSLQIREGLHGLKPLTDKDREDIRKNIKEKVLGTQAITFRSSEVKTDGDQVTVSGELTLSGQGRPASFALQRTADGRLQGTLTVTQSEWGIKPYRGLMGALKVRDAVEIALDVQLPASP
jgi:polyisoprenoid-binding protein YceI